MKRNTKEEILLESLRLFARDGYEGVTVRDIAEKLGIRQSSLYKHYENKQDIFISIVNRMNEEFQAKITSLSVPDGNFSEMAALYGREPLAEIKALGEGLFRYWTEDEYASAFRRMLILEQYRNNELSAFYQQYLAGGVIEYETKLFAEMIQQGYFKKNDPQQLAINFYGPIFLLMTVYDGAADKNGLVDLVIAHVEQFGRQYGTEGSK